MESCECHVISSHFREESDKLIVSLYLQSWSQTIIWEWSGVWLYWIHCLPYNGLFSWGANFHYFCCSPVTTRKQTQLQIAFSKPDPTNPARIMLSMLKAILAGVGWVWLARQVSQACLDTEAFLVETKIRSTCPKLKVHITSCARNQIVPRNLKPWNLIPGASSRFSRKFPPMKITRYTVFRSHTKLLLDPICPWDRTKTRNGLGNGSKNGSW